MVYLVKSASLLRDLPLEMNKIVELFLKDCLAIKPSVVFLFTLLTGHINLYTYFLSDKPQIKQIVVSVPGAPRYALTLRQILSELSTLDIKLQGSWH